MVMSLLDPPAIRRGIVSAMQIETSMPMSVEYSTHFPIVATLTSNLDLISVEDLVPLLANTR